MMQMAAALGEKDGFPLGPQLFCRFVGGRPFDSGLGARNPANPYYSVPFAPSFILFSPARGSGLGAKNPANPYYSVPFAPSFILFSLARGSRLGARSPANPYYSVPFAPSFILFSPPRGAGLGARNPANPYYSVPFAPSPTYFSLLRPAGRRLPAARGGVLLIFVYVHKEFVLFCVHGLFFIAFHKFLSII